MIKKILKYSFVFYFVILSVIARATTLSYNEFSGKDLFRTEKSQISQNKLKSVTDYFTSPNSELSNNHSVLTLVQKELNFDELTLKKDRLAKNQNFTPLFNLHCAPIQLTDIVHTDPPYAHFEEQYQTWYILYQVFRI